MERDILYRVKILYLDFVPEEFSEQRTYAVGPLLKNAESLGYVFDVDGNGISLHSVTRNKRTGPGFSGKAHIRLPGPLSRKRTTRAQIARSAGDQHTLPSGSRSARR